MRLTLRKMEESLPLDADEAMNEIESMENQYSSISQLVALSTDRRPLEETLRTLGTERERPRLPRFRRSQRARSQPSSTRPRS